MEKLIRLKLVTCECDGAALPVLSEHMGVATKYNCHRCLNPGVHNESEIFFFQKKKAFQFDFSFLFFSFEILLDGKGSYQTGYQTGLAFTAIRKDNETSREFSKEVAAKTKG